MELSVSVKRFSDREDLANALSHSLGALFSVAALIFMVVLSMHKESTLRLVCSVVFGLSMIFLYTSSAVAHWLPEGKRKDSFFTLDQIAIFVLIAGTYTPLSLIALNGKLGWLIFGIEWVFALIGILRLISRINKFESGVDFFDIFIYIGMGWLVFLVSGPVLRAIPMMGFIWIVIGGLFYTTGVIFFKVLKFRFHHLVWHLMVVGGTASHFIATYFYILPK